MKQDKRYDIHVIIKMGDTSITVICNAMSQTVGIFS